MPELPPFTGGAVGYAGYDTVRYVEHLPNAPPDDRKLPDLSFAFYDHMVVFDNVNKTMIVVAMARLDGDRGRDDPQRRMTTPAARVDRLVAQLSAPVASLRAGRHRHFGPVSRRCRITSNFTQAEFEAAVRKCVEYIRAGDIFQVVISQRLVLRRSRSIRSRSIARCGS